MPAPRGPWWLFVLALSFLAFFVFATYCRFWDPEPEGFDYEFRNGHRAVLNIIPNSPAATAGLEPGDRIVSVNGQVLRTSADWFAFRTNMELNRPLRLGIERVGEKRNAVLMLRKRAWADMTTTGRLQLLAWTALQLLTLGMAFVIAYSKPRDAVALLGAWLLATAAIFDLVTPRGRMAVWREVPTPISLFLWLPYLSILLGGSIFFTFFANFPRKIFRTRWPLALVWLPALLGDSEVARWMYRAIYHPEDMVGRSDWPSRFGSLFFSVALVSGVVVFVLQYRTLQDVNERRKLRVLVLGTAIALIAMLPRFLFFAAKGPSSGATPFFLAAPVQIVTLLLYLAFPLSFANAILHHRLFGIRVMIRRGLQYALARGVMISLVPGLAILLVVDLLLHGDQPLVAVLRGRGWVYGVLVGVALLAHSQRKDWLDALDRRFFREHYDARRLLREVVEEIHLAKTFDQEAPRVVTRIEAALHPEFAALLVREPRETSYHTLAAAPAGKSPPPLQKDSKLLALMRLLGKPLEVPQTESGWLQQQLPHEETDFLRQARIDLLVPVATSPQDTEAILVLGSKRSEEPYSAEDQDLLVAIAAGLAILLEKPAAVVLRRDVFEECPQCGVCYDSGSTKCSKEGARLVPVILPRLLEDRYRLERRLGRGGMGTVYEAIDKSLERRVAVKVIREDLVGSQEAAERFRGEARASASFAHPNVVTVHDFGVAGGTRAFLVMEILEGVTLRERLRLQGHLSPGQVVSIARGVSEALSAAHRRHLVHRDLKPENIFLVNSDSGELAKVLDFGLAKFLSNSTQQQTVDTAVGGVLGTLRYMSPEQRRGEAAHHAWDLWALAVVTYEMVTGAYPFEDNSPGDWFAAGPTVPFTPVAKYMPEAARRWQELFEHSFARELSSRHESSEAFLSDLQRLSS